MDSSVPIVFIIGDDIDKKMTIQVENPESLSDKKGYPNFTFRKSSWEDFSQTNTDISSSKYQKDFLETSKFTLVESLSDFLKEIENCFSSNTGNHYFRGQSAGSLPFPSILRSKKYLKNERNMFNEMFEAFPNEFKDINSDFDKLALMRANGMPARIIDLSTNPLVALYYACKHCSEDVPFGMVIEFTLQEDEKEVSSQEVKVKNVESNEFFSLCDDSQVIVRPSCFNAQVTNQQTAYLLWRNSADALMKNVCEFNKTHLGDKVFLIHNAKVEEILKELSAIGIDDYQMNPDIENLVKSVMGKYTSKKMEKTKEQEDYLVELSDAYIDRGYVPISQFFRNNCTESWTLSKSNSDPSDNSSVRVLKAEKEFDAENNGMIKFLQRGDPDYNQHILEWNSDTEEFRKKLENTIKAQLHERIRVLEVHEMQFHNNQTACNAYKQTPGIDNQKMDELNRRDREISRIIKRITHEQSRLRALEVDICIEIFPKKEKFEKYDKWPACILYDPARIHPVNVISVANLLTELEKFKEDQKVMLNPYNMYFRGQPLQYPVNALLYRDENYVKKEKDMYADLLARLPETFNKEPSIFDRLVVMKHYEFPSRLLDITRSPLNALLFACLNNTNKLDSKQFSMQAVNICFSKKDEEKDILSDTVVRLCSLALAKDWKFSEGEIEEFDYLNEIKYRSQRYTPGYYPIFPCLEELDKTILVHPSMNNKRIERQKGEFLISGRNTDNPLEQNSDVREFFLPNHFPPIPLFIVLGKFSEKILSQLKYQFGLDKAFIYPEMTYKANEIRERYRI